MQVSFHHIFPILVLTLLSAGSFWLERTTRAPEALPQSEQLRGPDLIVEGVAATRFDINGNPHYYLNAERMKHLPGSAHAELVQPRVHLVRDQLDMRLSSVSALVRDDGERVDMSGNVQGERTIPGEPTTHFASETLTVWPEVESAKSESPVTISQDGMTASGNRMDADNIFGVVVLSGDVKAHLPIKRK